MAFGLCHLVEERIVCAAADNRVYGWGYNAYGQIGNDGSTDTNLPTLSLMPVGTKALFSTGWPGSSSVILGALNCMPSV